MSEGIFLIRAIDCANAILSKVYEYILDLCFINLDLIVSGENVLQVVLYYCSDSFRCHSFYYGI